MFRYLPEQASEVAPKVDWLHHIITDLSVFFTVAIVGTMLYFAYKYRAKKGVDHSTPRIEGNHFLEAIWTIVPTIVCIFIGTYGILIFKEMRSVPDDALVVNVTGKKWNWTFQYENGKQLVGEAVIPVDRHVKFVLTSKDVLHSFFVPVMRVKSDAIPNRYTYVTFKPVKTGDYNIFCTEYCGMDHSQMLAKLKVVPQDEYDRWLNDNSETTKVSLAEIGESVYNQQGCMACHSVDGSKRVGPSFQNIYNREATYDQGKAYKADEEYIRESILNPNKHIVDGYPANQMPAYEGLISDDQIKALIAWFKTLDGKSSAATSSAPKAEFKFAKMYGKDTGPSLSPEAERGKALYAGKACIGCHSLDGSKVVGPTWKNLYAAKAHKMADGSAVDVNDSYIKESILNPNAKIVEGYQAGLMPSYQGQLSDAEISDIIEFMKTVK
jgi:cytochrome c oxidase subunit 2